MHVDLFRRRLMLTGVGVGSGTADLLLIALVAAWY
jgi:hypothetical protein